MLSLDVPASPWPRPSNSMESGLLIAFMAPLALLGSRSPGTGGLTCIGRACPTLSEECSVILGSCNTQPSHLEVEHNYLPIYPPIPNNASTCRLLPLWQS